MCTSKIYNMIDTHLKHDISQMRQCILGNVVDAAERKVKENTIKVKRI